MGTIARARGFPAMRPLLILLACLGLAACATTPRADVQRFHLSQPIPKGSVHVAPADAAAAGSLSAQVQGQAVAAELTRLGFTIEPDRQKAEYLALFQVTETARPGQARGPRMSVGIGGGTSIGRNVGIGGSVNVPVGPTPQPGTVRTTTLAVTISRQSDKTMVWEGRASKEVRDGGQNFPVLANALFRDFPGPSGQTVRVPL
jgi:hypothetical protein